MGSNSQAKEFDHQTAFCRFLFAQEIAASDSAYQLAARDLVVALDS